MGTAKTMGGSSILPAVLDTIWIVYDYGDSISHHRTQEGAEAALELYKEDRRQRDVEFDLLHGTETVQDDYKGMGIYEEKLYK